MRTYVGADTVVGLDVDKDAYDKYTMRSLIGERGAYQGVGPWEQQGLGHGGH